MKHNIPAPNLVEQYQKASAEDRREMSFLAFEAEFDVNRPFEVEWKEGDSYFEYEGETYYYKPAHPNGLQTVTDYTITIETPHLCQFKI
jgi:hypothetical protein